VKRKIIFLFLALLTLGINIFPNELSKDNLVKLRSMFYSCANSKDYLDSLSDFISTLNLNNNLNNNPILIAYSGVCNAMYAKYSFFPWDKLNNVNIGMHLLNKAVELDSTNLEIRFLRFTVLSNLPFFLGYASKARTEANVLYKMLKFTNTNEDSELVKNIVHYLIESNRLDKIKQEDLSQYFKLASK
jgi:hypothetical protein